MIPEQFLRQSASLWIMRNQKAKYRKLCITVRHKRRPAIIFRKKQSTKKQVPRESGMTEKELRHLSRPELLELLLQQTKEVEQLTEQLEKTERMLRNRYLQIKKAGDLANAVLEINGVMTAAQAAAQQYLDNMAQMEKETSARCERMLLAARREAARILKEAREAAAVDRMGTGAVRTPQSVRGNAEIGRPHAGTVQPSPKRKNQ